MTMRQHPLRHHYVYRHYFRCLYCKKKDIDVVPDKAPGIFLCKFCNGVYCCHTYEREEKHLVPVDARYIFISYCLMPLLLGLFCFICFVISFFSSDLDKTGHCYFALRILALFIGIGFWGSTLPGYLIHRLEHKSPDGPRIYYYEALLRGILALSSFYIYLKILDFFELLRTAGT